jgi:hypothetical protein
MPKTPFFFLKTTSKPQKNAQNPNLFSENDLKTPKIAETPIFSSENVKSGSLPKELKSGSAGAVGY